MFKFQPVNRFKTPERRSVGPATRRAIEGAFAGRPKEADFVNNPYTKAEVEADLARIKSREALAAKTPPTHEEAENKEAADTFEAAVLVFINKAGLMGRNVAAEKTSKYDDMINKVDMVAEFQWEGSASHLGLAADVTFSAKQEVIAKKFDAIRDRIKRGVLAEVKYFHSALTNSNHALTRIPEVIIGVSKRTVEELGHLLERGDYAALAQHKSGVRILRQIELQLATFERYAKSVNQPTAARIYSHMLILIEKILAGKATLVAHVEATPNTDPVHDEIMKFVGNWSRY